jgi:hypothetical protein
MNPRWLEDRILEILQEVQDLKEIMKAVNSPPPVKETKYPINKGK